MGLVSEDPNRVVKLLKQAPSRIREAAYGVRSVQLYIRTDKEPWSISDILIHLRACSDIWGTTIMNMLTEDNPIQRYKSPRAFMKKPRYQNQEFAPALESYTRECQNLVKVLTALDEVGWSRPGTYTGVTPRHRNQTGLSLANRLVNHEQPQLDQIEMLLK